MRLAVRVDDEGLWEGLVSLNERSREQWGSTAFKGWDGFNTIEVKELRYNMSVFENEKILRKERLTNERENEKIEKITLSKMKNTLSLDTTESL